MEQFTPYNIIHLGITGITTASLPAFPALCYVWWRGIPLGHLWLDGKARLSSEEFRARVLEQVRPALKYYLKDSAAANKWETYFVNNDNEQLEKLLYLELSSAQLIARENTYPISIIICTRNRASFLKTCIAAIMGNTDSNFELVVVDNAPDDDSTRNVVAGYPIAKYVLEPRKGLDIARNTGARNASHHIIAYTDDDVIVDKDWVKKLKNCFANPMVLAVTGQVIPMELKTKSQYLFEKYWGFNKGYIPRMLDYGYFTAHKDSSVPVWDIGAGANMAFRREVFEIAGWFDERLDVGAAGCSGDSELWYRILAEKWNCFYCPQLYVYHQHRDSEKALTNQVFNYMRGQVASLYVQYEHYGHKGNITRVHKVLPKYYLNRIWRRLTSGFAEDFGTIGTEIKGYISGLLFYRSARKAKNGTICPSIDFKPVADNTLVSVIITSYNYAHYLPQAIDSVLAQTYKHIEIIVVDDGSTDNTQEIIKKYPGIVSVITNRVGASAARNIGISYTTGDLLVFLDADDYLYKDAVALNSSFFRKYPESAFVSGAFDKVNDAGDILPGIAPREHLGKYYTELLLGNRIGMLGNIMYRRELFFQFHFNTQLLNCEDYALNLDISRCYPSYSHTAPIIGYRQHPGNKSENKKRMYAAIKKIFAYHYSKAEGKETKNIISSGLKIWKNYYRK